MRKIYGHQCTVACFAVIKYTMLVLLRYDLKEHVNPENHEIQLLTFKCNMHSRCFVFLIQPRVYKCLSIL